MKNPIIDAVLAEEAGAELELFSARDEASKRLAAAQEDAKRQLEMARADAASLLKRAKEAARKEADKAEEEASVERAALCAKLKEETLPKMDAAAKAALVQLG